MFNFSLTIDITVIHAKEKESFHGGKKTYVIGLWSRPYHKLLSVISEETHQVLTQKMKRDLVFFLL